MKAVLIGLGIVAAIFALSRLKFGHLGSALVYGCYAVCFFAVSWPRVLTYIAVVAVLDGILNLLSLFAKAGNYAALTLTPKGRKHFLLVEGCSCAIRLILMCVAWRFIGF